MPRAGVDRRSRLLVGRPAVADRNTMAMLHEIAHELDAPRQLRRKRNNPNGAPMVGDDTKDLLATERTLCTLCTRETQARNRLRAIELRIDEVALEMRGQDESGFRYPLGACAYDRLEESVQAVGRARDRGRAKRGDTVLRKPRRHIGNGIRTIEHVSAFEAMHVHIDEAGDD